MTTAHPPAEVMAGGLDAATERLLVAAHTVASIVTERQPDYFRHRPLRVVAPLPEGTADAFGLPLRSVGADGELDPVEQLLHRTWSGDERSPESLTGPERPAGPGYRAAVRSLRRRLDDDAAAFLARSATVLGPGSTRTLTTAAGAVTYLDSRAPAAGSELGDGSDADRRRPVLVLNAIGQGIGYWRRLAAALHPRRVLVWEARGVLDPAGGEPAGGEPADGGPGPYPTADRLRVAGLGDHVEDVRALLRHEGIGPVHVVGWCTGARVAATLARLEPDQVASLTFLNASFRDGQGSGELDTDYERQLDDLRKLAAARPARIPRVLHVLQAGLFDEARELTGPDDELAERVLSLPPPSLDAERRRPFADAASLLTYCRQLDDYWSTAGSPDGPAFAGPALFVVGSADDVVSEAAQRTAASTFGAATVVEIRAGTHYLMHDRSAEVARLIETFAAAAEEPAATGRDAHPSS